MSEKFSSGTINSTQTNKTNNMTTLYHMPLLMAEILPIRHKTPVKSINPITGTHDPNSLTLTFDNVT